MIQPNSVNAGRDIGVFIVDDSAVVRDVLSRMLSKTKGIQVIGTAQDPVFAKEKMKLNWPDVVILDVEMPRMDGITFLKQLMSEHPTPVVMCSSLTEKGAETTMQALSAGAVSIITKPKLGLANFLESAQAQVVNAVREAAAAKHGMAARAGLRNEPIARLPSMPPPQKAMAKTTEQIVAIGTSTGGTQALEAVLTALPRVCPPIVIVQHMPEHFTAAFSQRLNSLCKIEVREARHGDRLGSGLALVAPGGKHMQIERSGAQYTVSVTDGPPVNRHRPSVDVLFRSVARVAGANATGFIMTGMGDDGARGLLEMRQAGSHTFGQDENTCVVYGMPKEAFKMGAVERELPLDRIPGAIVAVNNH